MNRVHVYEYNTIGLYRGIDSDAHTGHVYAYEYSQELYLMEYLVSTFE